MFDGRDGVEVDSRDEGEDDAACQGVADPEGLASAEQAWSSLRQLRASGQQGGQTYLDSFVRRESSSSPASCGNPTRPPPIALPSIASCRRFRDPDLLSAAVRGEWKEVGGRKEQEIADRCSKAAAAAKAANPRGFVEASSRPPRRRSITAKQVLNGRTSSRVPARSKPTMPTGLHALPPELLTDILDNLRFAHSL